MTGWYLQVCVCVCVCVSEMFVRACTNLFDPGTVKLIILFVDELLVKATGG